MLHEGGILTGNVLQSQYKRREVCRSPHVPFCGPFLVPVSIYVASSPSTWKKKLCAPDVKQYVCNISKFSKLDPLSYLKNSFLKNWYEENRSDFKNYKKMQTQQRVCTIFFHLLGSKLLELPKVRTPSLC
jgi:hypothetical protein